MFKNKLPEELVFLENRNQEIKGCEKDFSDKLCIITGATSGVGYEALKYFASKNANLVIVARNKNKAEVCRNKILVKWNVTIDILIADFSDLADVEKLASEIITKYSQIDVFINSAGLHSTKKIMTKDNHELVFTVNHLAPFLLINLLLERFKKSASRIILVNSEGHRFNGLDLDDLDWQKRIYTGLRSYGASKTAQLLTMINFANLLKGSGATINAMHPGDVKTNIGNNNGVFYKLFLHHVTWHFLKDASKSGQALYYLAASDDLRGISGNFYNLCVKEVVAKHARDRIVAQVVWDLSLEMTNLD